MARVAEIGTADRGDQYAVKKQPAHSSECAGLRGILSPHWLADRTGYDFVRLAIILRTAPGMKGRQSALRRCSEMVYRGQDTMMVS